MAMQVLVELGKASVDAVAGDDGHPYPRAALRLILTRILHAQDSAAAEALDDLLHAALSRYGDIRFECYRLFPELLKEMKGSEGFESAAGRVIRHLGAIQVDSGFRRTLVPLPETVTKKAAVRCRTGHRSAYTACWLALLPLIPAEGGLALHKRVLALLDDTVIPQMTRPQLLIDYLTDAYNAGGIVSLLALGSLFTLIRRHNLDYPDFYPRLYALLDGRVLHIAYRRRFLRLLDLFMQSTMMPVWLVAAFVKRVARLALWAPAPSVQWVVPFIYNLLKRHPACRVLIHREGKECHLQASDPYDPTEANPAACNALQSSLWELSALSRHHWAPIARQARIFSERFSKPPMDLGKVLDEEPFTYEEVIKAELGHLWSKRPPTAIDIPTTPF